VIGEGRCEETIHFLSLILETCPFTVTPAVAFLSYVYEKVVHCRGFSPINWDFLRGFPKMSLFMAEGSTTKLR
jgi:hypothetical protein